MTHELNTSAIASKLRAAGLNVFINKTELMEPEVVTAKVVTPKQDATDRLFMAIFGETGNATVNPNKIEIQSIGDHAIAFMTNTISLVVGYELDENDDLIVVTCTKNGEDILCMSNRKRITNLLMLALKGKSVGSAFKSVTTWNQQMIPVHIIDYQNIGKNAGGSRMAMNLRGFGTFDHFQYIGTIDVMRRDSFVHSMIENGEAMVIKIAAKEEKVDEITLEKLFNKEDIPSMSAKKTKGFVNSYKKILAKMYPEFTMIGGSPDKGIGVLVRKYLAPKNVMKCQKLAKILLTGGNKLEGRKLKVKLVDFKSRRNGVFGIFKTRVLYSMLESSGLPTSQVMQCRIHVPTITAIKGVMLVAVTKELQAEWKDVDTEIDMLIDIKDWKDVFNPQKSIEIKLDDGTSIFFNVDKYMVGDVVELDPSCILVHKSNAERSSREVAISSQALLRAPIIIKNYLVHQMDKWLAEHEEAIVQDPLQFVQFGFYDKMHQLGIKPTLDNVGDIPTGIQNSLLKTLMCAKYVNGASEFLIYDSSLLKTEITVPRSWKVIENGEQRPVKIGDKIYILDYPLLYGGETAHSLVVADIHSKEYVTMNPDTAETGLRDEDGDRPIFILPEQRGYIWSRQNNKKFSHIKTETSITYDSTEEAYCNLVADVGSIDNLSSNVMLYTTEFPTPTGEELPHYCGCVIQAMIYRKKFQVQDAYSNNAFRAWTEEALPSELFDTKIGENGKEYKVLTPHPIMKTVKASTLADFRKYLMGVPLNFIARSVWEKMASFEIKKEGFVDNKYYKEWALNHLDICVDEEFISPGTIDAIGTIFGMLDDGVPDNATFDQKLRAYVDVVNQYRTKCNNGAKAMAMLWLLLIGTYPQYMWTTLVDSPFLAEMVNELNNGVPCPSLEFNGRNKERRVFKMDAVVDVAIPDQTKKIYCVNGMKYKLGTGQITKEQVSEWSKTTGEVSIRKTVVNDEEAFAIDDLMGKLLGYASKDSISLINGRNITKGKIVKANDYTLTIEPIIKL